MPKKTTLRKNTISTRTSNTFTLLSEVNKNRKIQMKNLEKEIEEERKKLVILGKQQKIQEKSMDTSNSVDSDSAWKKYQAAVKDKIKCTKSINSCLDKINKNKSTISKLSMSLKGGGRKSTKKKRT
jgi:hypothetical protein